MNTRTDVWRVFVDSNGFPALHEVDLQAAVAGDPFWEERLAPLASDGSMPFSLHLAVLVEPYLHLILTGRKTVESRFSARRCVPYERVHSGDVVLLKRSGGPVVGLFEVADTWFYRLDPESWRMIRAEFTQALCAGDRDFWTQRAGASYATLMRVRHARAIAPIRWPKRDRRPWVVLRSGPSRNANRSGSDSSHRGHREHREGRAQ